MKVQPSGPGRKALKGAGRSQDRRGQALRAGGQLTASRFWDALQAVEAIEEGQPHLPADLEALEEVAQRLMASPTPANLYEYRRVVGEILRRLLRDTFEVSAELGIVRAGRQKVFMLVRAVNQELEELTRLVLAKEKDRLAIVAKLGELRGLILDLYR